MATINIGTVANDGTGDSIRVGGQKVNDAIQAIVDTNIPVGTITESMIADGAVTTAKLPDAAVSNAKLASMAQATFKMRAAGAGTGVPIDGTASQAKTALGIGFSDITDLTSGAASEPAWATYSDIHNGMKFTMGGYSDANMFGNDLVGCAQALAVGLTVPATSAAGNHAAAIAGYGMTLSTGQGAVGLFGFGGIGINGASGWSFNTVTTNAAKVQPANDTGFDGGAVYAWEADFNIVKKSGAVEPNVPIRGIYMIGASQTRGASAVIRAIDIDGLNHTGTKIGWLDALYIADGAADRAINIGSTLVNTGSTTTNSQPVVFSAYLSGAQKSGQIYLESSGNVKIAPNAGSGGAVDTSAGAVYSVNGVTVADAAAKATWSPTVASTTGTITTVGTVSARYKKLGKIVHFDAEIPITTNGTGAGTIEVTLPSTPIHNFAAYGDETTAYGGILQVRGVASGAKLVLRKYDNTYPGADSATLYVAGHYEEA